MLGERISAHGPVLLDRHVDSGAAEDPRDPAWECRYEFIQKIILRVQKYAARGIHVINAPSGALQYSAHLLDHF